jgi:hypothetical protein
MKEGPAMTDAEKRITGMVGVAVGGYRKLCELALDCHGDHTPEDLLNLILEQVESAVNQACPESERDGFVEKVRELASKELGLDKNQASNGKKDL